VALEPSSAEAHLNLGGVLADAFDLQSALNEFSEVVRLAPQSASAHYNKGRTLFDLGRYTQARAELQSAVKLSPQLSPAMFLLAVIEQHLNRWQASAELLKKVVALEPANPDAHYLLAQALVKLGKTNEAVREWSNILELQPDQVEALYNLCHALGKSDPVRSREYDDRLLKLEQRLGINNEPERLQSFALFAANERDWPDAVQQLLEAIRICGNCGCSASLHRNLGLIYLHSGNVEAGERELRLALNATPQDLEASRALKLAQAARN
jgi:tetratricopeptide (TPR) repeat protein